MENTNLERFRLKVREYRLLVNHSQSDLAAYLNLDYNELSNRLNSHKNVRLSHENVRGVVRALADWGAITTQAQAEELLELMLCPRFDSVDLQAKPLSKLLTAPDPALTKTLTTIPDQTYVLTSVKARLLSPTTDPNKNISAPDQPLSHNLPKQLSSFIGRDKEIAELTKLLAQDQVSLLTLVGAGGCGKTRLSLQVAGQLLKNFKDGVWFVELAPLNDPTLIPLTIAGTMGLSEQGRNSIMTTLSNYLRSRHILLVLDNCEHLVEECARLVETLLHAAPNLNILATSREALGLNGEITFLVPSLSLPDLQAVPEIEKLPNYEAVRLFTKRAVAVNPNFLLTPANAQAVIDLCRHLDGIPLAIELAAARLKVLTLDQITTRLDARFRLLTGGSRTALPRQQTLQALVDWSYDLLSPIEQRVFARLSVFAGGWTLAAAVAVAGKSVSSEDLEEYAVLNALSGLVNKSLVQVNNDTSNDEARYSFLETIRQYAFEKLQETGEEPNICKDHLVFYATLAETLDRKVQGKGQLAALKVFEREQDNMRVAINYGLKLGRVEELFQLTLNLPHYWDTRGYYTEGQHYLQQVLALPSATGIDRGKALCWTGWITLRHGDAQMAASYFEESLAVSRQYDDKELLAFAFTGMGGMHFNRGNYSQAWHYYEKALPVAEGINLFWKGAALDNLGYAVRQLGNYEEARRLMDEALVILREEDNKWMITQNQINMAILALELENYGEAKTFVEEALSISEEIGFLLGKSTSLALLGIVQSNEGKVQEAVLSLGVSLSVIKTGGVTSNFPNLLVATAGLLSKIWMKIGQERLLKQSACLCGVISAFNFAMVQVLHLPFLTYYDQVLAVTQSGLNKSIFQEAFAMGEAMLLEEALDYTRNILAGI